MDKKLVKEFDNPVMEDQEDEDNEVDNQEETGGRRREEEEDDDDDVNGLHIEGMYDPEEFQDLAVSAEIRSVFAYIQRYTAPTVHLDCKLKTFLPEFIPAVGDTDPYLKMERIDRAGRKEEEMDTLGLVLLDEPAALQSDQSILELQLRSMSKESSRRTVRIKRVQVGEDPARRVEKWVKDIWELHRNRPAPTVNYAAVMPDIDLLMQEWPAEVETAISQSSLPSGDLHSDLVQYVGILCSFLDIPVYKSRIQSLHVMFTLYQAFLHSPHYILN